MTSMAPPFEIGKRLGTVRAQRGLSQGTVSRLAGLAPSYLSKIENGRIQPTFPTLYGSIFENLKKVKLNGQKIGPPRVDEAGKRQRVEAGVAESAAYSSGDVAEWSKAPHC